MKKKTKKPMSRSEYEKHWKDMGKIEIKMVKKSGKCRHKLGERHVYASPYDKPQKVCNALLHVLDLYTWRVVLDFPSWEADDSKVFRIHCPAKNGTVWEMRKR